MFDTGIILLAHKTVTGTNGAMPTEILSVYGRAYYGERSVSYSRFYEARGANSQVDMVVRVPFDTNVEPDSYVILENGRQLRVDVVTPVIVRRDIRAQELTLVNIDELLNVEEASNG